MGHRERKLWIIESILKFRHQEVIEVFLAPHSTPRKRISPFVGNLWKSWAYVKNNIAVNFQTLAVCNLFHWANIFFHWLIICEYSVFQIAFFPRDWASNTIYFWLKRTLCVQNNLDGFQYAQPFYLEKKNKEHKFRFYLDLCLRHVENNHQKL